MPFRDASGQRLQRAGFGCCEERLEPENTDFVRMVCTAEYRRRIQGKAELDQGRGVFWEGNLIYGYL